ncbi:g10054 [Coccomyxa elongata]
MYYQKEELFWRERQQKLRVLSVLQASTSCHSMVASSIAPPPDRPSQLQTEHLDGGIKLHENQRMADGDWVLKAVPAAQLCLGSSNRQQLQLQKHVLALAELRQDLADRVCAAEAGKLAAAERKLAEQRRLERQLEMRLRRACSSIEDQEARVQALMQEVDSELRAYSGLLQGVGHQPEEQDLARMAAQVERLHRKKAALSLVTNIGHPVPISALTSKGTRSDSSPGGDRAGGNKDATETLQTIPAHFSALRQAMNVSRGMVGKAGRAPISDWEHETSLEAADIDLEGLPSADEALHSILGQMEQRHKLSIAQVQQACAAQLTALQDEYRAALEEREMGYSELLEELRCLRRRCPSPRDGRTAARADFDHQESQQVHISTGVYPREEPRLFKEGQPAGAAAAARQPHLGSCREASTQMPCSRSPPEHGLTRRPASHNALQHDIDGNRGHDRQYSYLQQQDGDSGRQWGHLKPSRIPSMRPRLVQPCSPREVLDSPGCPSAAKPAVHAVPPQQEHTPAQHQLPAQQHTTPGPRSRSPAELLWPTPPSPSRDSQPGAFPQYKQVPAMEERERDTAQARSAPADHQGIKHISRADLDLILGASAQASEGVAALLQGLELPR